MKPDAPDVFEMWSTADADDETYNNKGPMHIPAPKVPLPGHAESYRPPEEYLLTAEEEQQWLEMDPDERPTNFLPKRHDILSVDVWQQLLSPAPSWHLIVRNQQTCCLTYTHVSHTATAQQVGAYADMCKERFERCLDLYLCPRAFKRRLNIDPESLVPKLPRPRDLRPFPNELCLTFGTSGGPRVRSLAVSEDGQYLCSGDERGRLQLWEVATARQLSVLELGGSNPKTRAPIAHMAWNPCGQHHVLAVAVGSAVVLVSTGSAGGDALDVTEALLAAAAELDGATTTAADGTAATADATTDATAGADSDSDAADTTAAAAKPLQDAAVAAAKRTAAVWEKVAPVNSSSSSSSSSSGAGSGKLQVRAVIRCAGDVGWVAWHRKGDYLVSVVPSPNAGSGAVAVHQVSKARTQAPLKKKSKGEPQCACFHPTKPFLFVATKQHVRVYHLVKQALVKRLLTGCKWISYMDIHPTGDHVLLGSLDRRVAWFDMDLASTPYKTLRYHTKAIRCALFHRQ
eukprot:12760-Heterococcus_DN1.PRE.1